ncbi:MAG: SDR family oxidoreductase [Pyrinomonadaceae bacterium]|nr:SDR family oxidoreductase [Pyrinomonadaceae bacterium]
MEKVVLITGASSGIGLETVRLFQSRNWKVAATMRKPEISKDLAKIADVELFRLDVTDRDSIASAVKGAIETFGKIDILVNNAGYSLVGPFEAASDEQVRKQFDTNVFGLMNVCREVIPHFRARKSGIIVNIASVGGRVAFPLYSLYHSTKWAVEGFSESLQFELEKFNIRVKIIEPGPIKTDFYERSQEVAKKEDLHAYEDLTERTLPNMAKFGETAPDGSIVAEAIYTAATDGTKKLRYKVNSKGLLTARRFLPDSLFNRLIRSIMID